MWLWLPVGCVPTTYAKRIPRPWPPGNDRCPCFTHPLYNQYLQAFLKELLETYPIDGVVMIRDDNGGLCPCERCKAYVARSTKSAAWEQYLILYRWLAGKFAATSRSIRTSTITSRGSTRSCPPTCSSSATGAGRPARPQLRTLAPMGDTWLDNVLASFRVPTAARMRRLLADRDSFWLGGAYSRQRADLAGDRPFRLGAHGHGEHAAVTSKASASQFGREHMRWPMSSWPVIGAYEAYWEIYDLPMLPQEWMKLRRGTAYQHGRTGAPAARRIPAARRRPRADLPESSHEPWLRHVELFGVYFKYHLRRLELFARMHDLAVSN